MKWLDIHATKGTMRPSVHEARVYQRDEYTVACVHWVARCSALSSDRLSMLA
jgi:hypothetical protein